MAVVIRRGKGGVRVLWNGKEEIVGVRERRGVMEFVFRDGKTVRTDNRHLFEIVKRRLGDGRK